MLIYDGLQFSILNNDELQVNYRLIIIQLSDLFLSSVSTSIFPDYFKVFRASRFRIGYKFVTFYITKFVGTLISIFVPNFTCLPLTVVPIKRKLRISGDYHMSFCIQGKMFFRKVAHFVRTSHAIYQGRKAAIASLSHQKFTRSICFAGLLSIENKNV
jgi:hypothetical protein